MKQLTFASLLVISLLLVASCQKSDTIEPKQEHISEYYVSYLCNKMVANIHVSYTGEDGKSVSVPNVAGGDFKRTIGPVSKGFTANFSVDTGTGTQIPIRIEVSKDAGPFVVKAEASNRVSYTIE